MATEKKIAKYLDMPLQHAHPEMLRAMNRPRDVQHVREVLARARELMPEIALRTTFIVGFPGETRDHFQAILDLMAEVQFDHVGIFPYYPEEGTPAAALEKQVSDRTKQRRRREALDLQQRISLTRNEAFIGRELAVLVDGAADQSIASRGLDLVGRTYRDAPEVDGFVLFRGRARRGDLVPVRITAAGPYDLFGEQTNASPVGEPALPRLAEIAPQHTARRIGVKSLPVLQPR